MSGEGPFNTNPEQEKINLREEMRVRYADVSIGELRNILKNMMETLDRMKQLGHLKPEASMRKKLELEMDLLSDIIKDKARGTIGGLYPPKP